MLRTGPGHRLQRPRFVYADNNHCKSVVHTLFKPFRLPEANAEAETLQSVPERFACPSRLQAEFSRSEGSKLRLMLLMNSGILKVSDIAVWPCFDALAQDLSLFDDWRGSCVVYWRSERTRQSELGRAVGYGTIMGSGAAL